MPNASCIDGSFNDHRKDVRLKRGGGGGSTGTGISGEPDCDCCEPLRWHAPTEAATALTRLVAPGDSGRWCMKRGRGRERERRRT